MSILSSSLPLLAKAMGAIRLRQKRIANADRARKGGRLNVIIFVLEQKVFFTFSTLAFSMGKLN